MRKLNWVAQIIIVRLLLSGPAVWSQPAVSYIEVKVVPDHPDWQYRLGEPVNFTISVLRAGHPVSGVQIQYKIGLEKMPNANATSLTLKNGVTTIAGGTLTAPGFLCATVTTEIGGKTYQGIANAAFAPEQIQPTTELPQDFSAFWEKARTEASQIPLDLKLTLLPEQCTAAVDVFLLSCQNYRPNSRIYGILAQPKKPGKYPALLRVPGAGVRGYIADVKMAEKGLLTLTIGIHGIPVNLDKSLYEDLGRSALHEYWLYNLDNRDLYYYKRVYLGCVRAVDCIFSLPNFDGINLGVTGGSQGGALSIITAALDPRVKVLAAYYPALCDLTGYLKGRAGGWPHLFNLVNQNPETFQLNQIRTTRYYDVVNFARQLKIPGYYAWGFNDPTCPPTSMYSAYNVISAPKKLVIVQETGHWAYPETYEITDQWLINHLLGDGLQDPK
ncbi:acetylxylan esterase [candidate division KSB1 bacterium]|nr:acetylxylan esterase [candidate division KSB1 bacterium]